MHRDPRAVVIALAALLCGCGSSGPAATSTPATTPVPTPTATPTPGPDTLGVDVLASGVGVYLLTTIPVAVVHNVATAHAATTVQVRFAVFDSAGRPVGGADALIPYLAPGQTMGIGAQIHLSGSGLRASASILGAQWTPAGPTPPVTFGPSSYAAGPCGSCPSGPGYGTASATLSAAPGATVSNVTVTVVCYRGAAIIGGGSDVKAVIALPQPLQEAVVVTTAPDRCVMYASPGP